jgi:hypothetical protein
MSQFSVKTILAHRYKIMHPLKGDQSLDRYLATDQETNTEVELITPSARDILKAEQRTNFLNTHDKNQSNRQGYISCLNTFIEGSKPVAVYPSIQAPFPVGVSLDLKQSQELVQFLSPLLAEMKEPLRYSNLLVTLQGSVAYRPRGYTSKRNKILGHPLEDPTDERGNAFALSMMIYQSLFSLPEWRKKQEQIEWLSRDISLIDQESSCPMELEHGFKALLSGKPANLVAMTSFQLDLPKELPLRGKKNTSTIVNQTEELRKTTPSLRVDIPYPHCVLFISPPISDSNRKILSAVLDINPEAMSRHLKDGAIPIYGSSSKTEVETKIQEFSEMGILANMKTGAINFSLVAISMLATFLSIGLFTLNPALGIFLFILIAVVDFAVFFFHLRTQAQFRKQFKEIHTLQAQSELDNALQEARSKIFHSELPQIAKTDYYEIVDEIEERGHDPSQEKDCIALITQINPIMQDDISGNSSLTNKKSLQQKLTSLQEMSQSLE